MGKAKTQRTEALHQAARRYVLAKQAQQAIEQHHFDKLIERGLVVAEQWEGGFQKGLTPQGAGIGFNHNVTRSIY